MVEVLEGVGKYDDDTLYGGAGRDVLAVNSGDDVLTFGGRAHSRRTSVNGSGNWRILFSAEN